jgi:hypothetical protein
MEAATTHLLFGPPGSQIGTGGFAHPDHGDPQRLWDGGYKMNPPNNFSRINEGRAELFDHVLASHAMVGKLIDAATMPLDVPRIGTIRTWNRALTRHRITGQSSPISISDRLSTRWRGDTPAPPSHSLRGMSARGQFFGVPLRREHRPVVLARKPGRPHDGRHER